METTLPLLPEVLVDEIQKMACIKKSNGKKGNNFIIICKYKARGTKPRVKEIYKWLFSCLDNIKHPAVWDGCQYDWNIILDTYGHEDEVTAGGSEENYVYFYIHTSNRRDGPMDEENLIYVCEEAPIIEMSADYILEHIGNEPEYIVGIGVSAVSNEFMATEWWDIIDEQQGYMRRPMWNRWNGVPGKDDFGWSSIREKSFKFGWKNYQPPEN